MPKLPGWRAAALVAVAVGAVLTIATSDQLFPPRPASISTDRLGPDQGERVSDYLIRANDSLAGADGDEPDVDGDKPDVDDKHWALVSFTKELTPAQIPAHHGGLRIGQVLHRVPIPRVQTPIVAVQVPAGDAVAVASANAAAWQLLDQLKYAGSDERITASTTVSAARLRAGCACTVGLIVRGTLPQLGDLAEQPDIRAVEALPSDAVAGQFAVIPLLPNQAQIVEPGPDDGPIPDQ